MLFRKLKIKKKEKEYLQYLSNHTRAVGEGLMELVMCDELSYLWEDEGFYNKLLDRINNHDASKYSQEEFDAYRKFYYPIDEEEKKQGEKEFLKAWEHHLQCNDHHWQARSNYTEFTDDVKLAILENVCDWLAMGYMYGNRPFDYFCTILNEIVLPKEDFAFLEKVVKALEITDSDNEWYNMGKYIYGRK